MVNEQGGFVITVSPEAWKDFQRLQDIMRESICSLKNMEGPDLPEKWKWKSGHRFSVMGRYFTVADDGIAYPDDSPPPLPDDVSDELRRAWDDAHADDLATPVIVDVKQ